MCCLTTCFSYWHKIPCPYWAYQTWCLKITGTFHLQRDSSEKTINKSVEVMSACVILRYWIFHNWAEADKKKQIVIQGGPLHKNSGPMIPLTTRCLPPLHFQMLNIRLSIPTQIHPDAELPAIHPKSPRVLEPLREYWNTQNMCSKVEGMEEAERTIWSNSLLKLEP